MIVSYLNELSFFYFRLQCRFVASNSQLQYSDIVDGKPVTLSMAIDSIESLQRQLNDVERKVNKLLFSKKQSRIWPILGGLGRCFIKLHHGIPWDCFGALALL